VDTENDEDANATKIANCRNLQAFALAIIVALKSSSLL
jgi:hypothetical protein